MTLLPGRNIQARLGFLLIVVDEVLMKQAALWVSIQSDLMYPTFPLQTIRIGRLRNARNLERGGAADGCYPVSFVSP